MDRSGRVIVGILIGASISSVLGACTDDSHSVTDAGQGGSDAGQGGTGGGVAGQGGGDAGQDGGDAWQGLADYAEHFPPACGPLTKLVEYVYTYKTCAKDADCTHVGSTCLETREHCSGAFYVNVQHDTKTLQSLFSSASTCPLESPCCTATPPPARCVHDRCVPDGSLIALTNCLAGVGGDGACDFCACASEGFSHDCVYDPTCIPIFKCAQAAGCYGTIACDLAAPGFPCKAEVDAAGGPKSEVAEAFRRANADAPRRGCDVACAP